jgi:hypothetical protein
MDDLRSEERVMYGTKKEQIKYEGRATLDFEEA